jgi:hypothetical protein
MRRKKAKKTNDSKEKEKTNFNFIFGKRPLTWTAPKGFFVMFLNPLVKRCTNIPPKKNHTKSHTKKEEGPMW